MNHIAILTKNNIELTKKCVDSFRNQDVPVKIHVYDNDSVDETQEWLESQDEIVNHSTGIDLGVSAGWNFLLDILFYNWDAETVTVANNDIIVAPWTIRKLSEYPVEFITGIAVDDINSLKEEAASNLNLDLHPDFSLFMIHKTAYQKIGHFDEDMILYASDCDYHVRGHRLGVGMYKVAIPFYHINSSTLRLATDPIRNAIQQQANADREVFRKKYGCIPGEEAYGELFK